MVPGSGFHKPFNGIMGKFIPAGDLNLPAPSRSRVYTDRTKLRSFGCNDGETTTGETMKDFIDLRTPEQVAAALKARAPKEVASGFRHAPQVDFRLGPVAHSVCVPSGTCLFSFRGSVAHGMATIDEPESIDDIDLIGIVLAQPEHYLGLSEWGSRGTKEIKDGPYDIVVYELKKMFGMLLQGNPNVMSLLWVKPEHYLRLTEAGHRLVNNRELFVGKHLYDSFAAYARAQLYKAESRDPAELREYIALTVEAKYRGIHPQHKGEEIQYPSGTDALSGEFRNVQAHSNEVLLAKLRHYMKKGENLGYMGDKRKGLVLKYGYDAKNLAHCVRLLRMCKEFLATGELVVFRPDAEELLEIKRGEWTLERVKEHARQLSAEVEVAKDQSKLPDGPNRERAERLLVSILRDHLIS